MRADQSPRVGVSRPARIPEPRERVAPTDDRQPRCGSARDLLLRERV